MATSWGLPESVQGGLKGGLQRGLQTEFGLEGHLLSSSGLGQVQVRSGLVQVGASLFGA